MTASIRICSGIILAVVIPTYTSIDSAQAKPPELDVHCVGEYAAIPWVKPSTAKPGSRNDRVRNLNFSVASVNLHDDMSDDASVNQIPFRISSSPGLNPRKSSY